MLQHLYIRNYALIRELDIQFAEGFSVITGETGAGKSIILGALGLLMGERADSKAIRDGEQKCVLEASFKSQKLEAKSQDSLQVWFEANDLDYAEECVIRREINVSGKSRAFINDTPVNLGLLKELGNQLIDIHSQHENLLLQDDTFQLSLVDAMAGNTALQEDYQAAYTAHKATAKQLRNLIEEATKHQQDADYIAFQLKQLQEAKLQAGEETDLEKEHERLTHAEEIKTQLSLAAGYLAEEDKAITAVREALTALHKVEAFLPDTEVVERLQSTYIELKDIAESVEDWQEKTEYDPARLQLVEERLDLINTLLQKHHLQTTQDLLALQNDLQQQMTRIENFDEEIATLQKQEKAQAQARNQQAASLSASRKSVLPTIEQHLENELTQLGIPNAKITLQQQTLADYTATGNDDIQLLFSANKNSQLRNVAEVASGGEISRLMLCIKAMLAQKKALPTLIFDEIDTGVSGEIAARMGHIMQAMGQQMQIISITHLPQIAALGQTHYKVYKQDTEERTETHIAQLTHEERILQLAQMLSGSSVSEAAIQNAKELLKCCH